MKVEQSIIINNKPVTKLSSFNGMVIFQEIKGDEDYGVKLYFTEKNEVIQTLEIEADCGQNIGFISELNFKGVD